MSVFSIAIICLTSTCNLVLLFSLCVFRELMELSAPWGREAIKDSW